MLGKPRAEHRAERGKIRRCVKHPVVEQLVEEQRMPGDELRRPARRADDPRHALECLRMLGEEREVGSTARDRLEECDAARERRLRIRRALRCLRQRRHDAIEASA